MDFLLTEKQLNYLLENIQYDRPHLYTSVILAQSDNNDKVLMLSEETASDIRDWAGEKLQKCGFDSNYNLTKEGEILEQIVDVLYI